MKKVTMKAQHLPSVSINEEKFITREQLTSLLKTYNSYYSDQENLQLTHNQREGSKPFIEGILSIFWGVRHPIRLKIQDEKQIPSFVTLKSTENVGLFPGKRGMTRWGEFDDLHHISGETLKSTEEKPDLEKGHSCYESCTLKPVSEQDHNCATLPRAGSRAADVPKGTRLRMIARTEVETHRFSINGHFYNYETSVFTPAFGSETKIRINSQMRTRQVIEQLLRKFKIENSPHEFALYIIHASGEKKQLRSGDVPLLHRLLQGPSEKVAKFFLMDRDVEEISSDVAQYIQFHLPFLESILHRINEEEEQEIQQTIARYLKEKSLIRQHLRSRTVKKTETTV
ncbi:ras association domain-containing protein 6 isoform X1 [Rissa tridactyla]|uniref:ras association domain-containing protein 6 isoform X1 n=1 Tax=Rissa tridactyla TaxID=75485 RepID=UPI0023BA57EB|nr:ras association domain-containing protein 6 isoform X1 [Rissa tridactyla]XP_054059845.1 ras association domain-containing protein 6 isoform X1 [Rissa tridactyla]XP_054059846.1 ras association domain-containing protein 6 isoform X1 [Rissa tridactyla]XP_054059847.1 ras association domain-containing protein 6 isoform X1 [Rissa tridactyla]